MFGTLMEIDEGALPVDSECQLGSGLVFSAHDDRLVERRGSIPTDGSVDAAPAARTGLSACRVCSREVLQYTPLWGLQLTAGHYVFEMWARADPSPTALQKVHLSVHTHAESVPPIAETTMSLTPSYSEGRLEFDVPKPTSVDASVGAETMAA